MRLGIISGWDEEGFNYVNKLGLSNVEFCVNNNYNSEEILKEIPKIKERIKRYGVLVGSIGRWGMKRISNDGAVIKEALQHDINLIDVAFELGCPVYNCGCNVMWSSISGHSKPREHNICLASSKYSLQITA